MSEISPRPGMTRRRVIVGGIATLLGTSIVGSALAPACQPVPQPDDSDPMADGADRFDEMAEQMTGANETMGRGTDQPAGEPSKAATDVSAERSHWIDAGQGLAAGIANRGIDVVAGKFDLPIGNAKSVDRRRRDDETKEAYDRVLARHSRREIFSATYKTVILESYVDEAISRLAPSKILDTADVRGDAWPVGAAIASAAALVSSRSKERPERSLPVQTFGASLLFWWQQRNGGITHNLAGRTTYNMPVIAKAMVIHDRARKQYPDEIGKYPDEIRNVAAEVAWRRAHPDPLNIDGAIDANEAARPPEPGNRPGFIEIFPQRDDSR